MQAKDEPVGMVDDEEDDDPVVKEMPVFLSQDLSNNLCMLHFPLRPACRPYEDDLGEVSHIKVKPMQKRIELQYKIETDSNNFDIRAPNVIKKLTLVSKPVPPKTNYAVGMIREGQLHLTPLNTVVRMVPSCDYIDINEQNEKMAEAAREAEMEDGESKKPEGNVELRPLHVKFKEKETERSQSYRKLTHAYYKQIMDQEKWIDFEWNSKDSEGSAAEKEKLVGQSAVPINFNMSRSDYLSHLGPSSTSSIPMPSSSLENLPASLTTQVITLLKNGERCFV